MVDRIADDHRSACSLAERLSTIRGIEVSAPETNIVLVRLVSGAQARPTVQRLAQEGVLALACDDQTIRLVTHRHVKKVDTMATVRAFSTVMSETSA
jgi:threonine aldolase